MERGITLLTTRLKDIVRLALASAPNPGTDDDAVVPGAEPAD